MSVDVFSEAEFENFGNVFRGHAQRTRTCACQRVNFRYEFPTA
jgi:hypothetical protein